MLLLCLHSPLLDILGDKGDGDSCGSLMVVKWRRQSSLHLHPLSPSLKCRHLLTTLSPWLVNGYTWAICWKIGKLYLCQTSSNHCQFFSHIVKFDFGLGNIFCGIVVIGIIRHVWGSWKNWMETGISMRQHLLASPISLSKDFTVSVSVWDLDIEDVGSV